MKKIFFLGLVLFLLLPVVFADDADQTPKQLAIQKKIDKGKELTREEFRLASFPQKEQYMLTEHFNPKEPDQSAMFEILAMKPEFDYAGNMGLVKKYLAAQGNFRSDQRYIFMAAAEEDIGLVNENPFYVRMYTGTSRFNMAPGVQFSKVENGKLVPKGEHSTPFDVNMIRAFVKGGASSLLVQEDGSLKYDNDEGTHGIEGMDALDFSGKLVNKDGFGIQCKTCKVGLTSYNDQSLTYAEGNVKLTNGHELKTGSIVLHGPDNLHISSYGDMEEPAFITRPGVGLHMVGLYSYHEGQAPFFPASSNYIVSDIDKASGISQLIIDSRDALIVDLPEDQPYKLVRTSGGTGFHQITLQQKRKGGTHSVDLHGGGFEFAGSIPGLALFNEDSGHFFSGDRVGLCDLNCYEIVGPLRARLSHANAKRIREEYLAGRYIDIDEIFRQEVDPGLYLDILEQWADETDLTNARKAATAVHTLYVQKDSPYYDRVQDLRERLLAYPDAITQMNVAEELDREEQLAVYKRVYGHPGFDQSAKDQARFKLAELQSPEIRQELEDLMATEPVKAISLLRLYEDDATVQLITSQHDSSDLDVRRTVARYLTGKGDVATLRKMWDNEPLELWQDTLLFDISVTDTPEAVGFFAEQLKKNPNDLQALSYLISMEGEHLLPDIQNTLRTWTKDFDESKFTGKKEQLDRTKRKVQYKLREKESAYYKTLTHKVQEEADESYKGKKTDWYNHLQSSNLHQHAGQAEALVRKVALLDDQRVDYKDLAIISHRSDEELQSLKNNRAELEAEISARIASNNPFTRPTNRMYKTESFDEQKHRLSLPELMKIGTAIESYGKKEVLKQVRTIRDRDTKNRFTELGGKVSLTEQGNLDFQVIAPLEADSNEQYVHATALAESAKAGVADFHFHAVDPNFDDAKYAGPSGSHDSGGGDLGVATTLHVDGIVMTSLDECHINADFYTSRGVVVDVGTYDICQ